MQQLLIVTGFVALFLFGLLIFQLQGLLAPATLAQAALACAAALTLFYTAFSTGLNRRARDRSLTALQALCGTAILLWVIHQAPATHIMFGPYLFVAVAFGTLRLPRAEVFALTTLALAGFAALIGMHYLQRQDAGLLQAEALHLLVTMLALPGFLLLAARVRYMNDALLKAGARIVTIKQTARRDPLLGCYNRRYTTAALEQARRSADARGAPLCLALLDLDHFKRVNDELGHLGGDEVLQGFASVVQSHVRRGDVFGRYGGEEFLLILPGTGLAAAFDIAERIRAQVAGHRWNRRLSRPVTVSIGLTQYQPGESVLELFSRADSATYQAKNSGRNQVVVDEPSTTTEPGPAA